MVTSRSVLLRMRNAADKSRIENQNILFMYNNFFPENRAVYEIVWVNMVESYRAQMTIRRMRIAYWIPKATNTHLQYVTLIAFPLQKWSNKHASIMPLHMRCLSCLNSGVFLRAEEREGQL